jgi:hypothetical protein
MPVIPLSRSQSPRRWLPSLLASAHVVQSSLQFRCFDWVEHIPFSETRNYVQRIMENLQSIARASAAERGCRSKPICSAASAEKIALDPHALITSPVHEPLSISSACLSIRALNLLHFLGSFCQLGMPRYFNRPAICARRSCASKPPSSRTS